MEPDPRSAPEAAGGMHVVTQPVAAPLTRAAIFLVATIEPGPRASRHAFGRCAETWPRCCGRWSFATLKGRSPASWGLGPMRGTSSLGRRGRRCCIRSGRFDAGARHAVSTPGDLLFHIRSKRMDLCFELATQIMARLGDAVSPVDEVQGFRYFDDRDLLGFVDGTENPRGGEAIDAVLVGEEDPAFAGGSYVIVQKYLHDLDGWNALPTEAQERIIGRTKLADIELDDSIKPTSAHNALTTIVEDGKEIKILRDNMPFGRPGYGEFGTYFIGYSRSPRTIEQMLENMFVGRPPGNYDRLLDFSRAVTGNLFFVPTATFLDDRNRRPACRCDAFHRGARLNRLHPAIRGTMVRSVSVPSKEISPMNNLHRELAPISDAAWAQIEEETSRTLKRYLAGRRVVDVQGASGHRPLRRRHRPPADDCGSERGHRRPAARGEGAGRVACSVRAGSAGD